jgi:hypothetical protein
MWHRSPGDGKRNGPLNVVIVNQMTRLITHKDFIYYSPWKLSITPELTCVTGQYTYASFLGSGFVLDEHCRGAAVCWHFNKVLDIYFLARKLHKLLLNARTFAIFRTVWTFATLSKPVQNKTLLLALNHYTRSFYQQKFIITRTTYAKSLLSAKTRLITRSKYKASHKIWFLHLLHNNSAPEISAAAPICHSFWTLPWSFKFHRQSALYIGYVLLCQKGKL